MLVVRAVLVVTAVAVAVAGVATEGETVEVTLRQGRLRGVALPAGDSRVYYSFRGIPYAEPPVGKLRFKDPVPGGEWSGVRDSFSPAPCPQINFADFLKGQTEVLGEEDCLYLHVYTPSLSTSQRLPVMVYIHGGGFMCGDSDKFGGSPLPLLTKDVVLVSLQYRLGALGFLSTEDDVLPGNLGLKDQTLALRWVQDNIPSFGGDPSRVTIFGESAGAGSVHLQMFTPEAQGLFQRVIMHSGNALCPWSYTYDAKQLAAQVAREFGCPGVDEAGLTDSAALRNCLMDVDPLKLAGVAAVLFPRPYIDGHYLPDHPATLLRKGRYHKVDLMSGVTKHEAGFNMKSFLLQFPEDAPLLGNHTEAFTRYPGLSREGSKELAVKVLYYYLGDMDTVIKGDKIEAMMEMLSDNFFTVPHDLGAQFHARDLAYGRPTYLFQLDHRGQASFNDMIPGDYGKHWVGHLDDLQYIFNDVLGFPPLQRLDDLVLSEIMLRLWTNFAATGNPTPDMSLGFRWCPATPSNLHHLSLTPAASMQPNTRAKAREFLRTLPTHQNQLLYPELFTEELSSCTPVHTCSSDCSHRCTQTHTCP